MKRTLREIVQGLAFGLLAAWTYAWVLLIWDWAARPNPTWFRFHDKLVASLAFLFIGSVFAVPLGICLGVLLPRICSRATRGAALLRSSLAGILVGLAGGFIFARYLPGIPTSKRWLNPLQFAVYVAIWSCLYSLLLTRGSRLNEQPS